MESDRMGYLLPALTDAKFENQRDVVLNERRQKYENRPYGLAGMAIVAALYPPIIRITGSRSARPKTSPPRRSTTCASSSGPTTVRRMRRSRSRATSSPTRPFGSPKPTSASSTPATRCRRSWLRFRGRGTRRHGSSWRIGSSCRAFTWRGIRRRCSRPAMPSSIWSPKCSRAGRPRACIARWSSSSGWQPRSRRRRTRARSAASSRSSRPPLPAARWSRSSARLPRRSRPSSSRGPTAIEMERCRAQAEAQFVYRLQTVGGFGGKGDQLNAYNVFLGQPDYFDRDLARYRGASAASLQQAAAACLRPESRVILERRSRGAHRGCAG